MQIIKYKEWLATYKPVGYKEVPEGHMFDTFDNREDVDAPNEYVWTQCHSSGEGWYISSGMHFVDSLEYYVTEVPWTEEIEVQ